MDSIRREPSRASEGIYDLIVIGGGIYGTMLAHEASRCGMSAILLEKDDFGQHTSFNTLRIIHGGLRYLQSLDIHRFRESVAERAWFLENFADFVHPIPCLMPLYGNGIKSPSVFRVALLLNHLLSYNRNRRKRPDKRIPYGRILNARETGKLLPVIMSEGLKGAAVWYDAFMEDSQCLVSEALRRACSMGAVALNYMEVEELRVQDGEVGGVSALDRESGRAYEVKGRRVVNTAGPWCREIAKRFHRDIPDLFSPSLAWNVLIDKVSLNDHALAATPRRRGGQTFFLVPWKGAVLAGTGHAPCSVYDGKPPVVTKGQIEEFIRELNEALPAAQFSIKNVIHVFSGYLPVTGMGSTKLTHREIIMDHAREGGPRGLYSVSGIKFTTARLVAEKVLASMFPDREFKRSGLEFSGREADRLKWDLADAERLEKQFSADPDTWKRKIEKIMDDEGAVHLDDLVIRRLPTYETSEQVLRLSGLICRALQWDEERWAKERARLDGFLSGV
jgi:glycerol-3-phosphate dehydrogenase